MKVRELKAKRAEILAEARKLTETAESENRSLSDEERAQVNSLIDQADNMQGEIETRERLAARYTEENSPANIGMSAQEVRKYSLLRAIQASLAARMGEPRAWERAGLEAEASRAVAAKLGKEPQGFYMPFDVQHRDLTAGTPSAGGYLVEDDLTTIPFVDLLRNKMILRQAGAQFISGLVGDVAVPKQSAGATAYWVAESGTITESALTLGQVALTPHTLGAYTDISRKLLKQSSIDVEMLVRNDLARVIAIEIDRAGLHGSGSSNEPTGVDHVSGIGSSVGGTDGGAPDLGDLVTLEKEVAVDNADIGTLAYITNPKVRGKLKQTLITATYGDRLVWEPGSKELNGYPVYVTNQVSSTLSKGSSTGVCSAIFFGNWNDLIIGQWGGLDVLVDPYAGATAGNLRILVFSDVDVAVRHAQSFAAMLDATTT